jgi:hypothetical protein
MGIVPHLTPPKLSLNRYNPERFKNEFKGLESGYLIQETRKLEKRSQYWSGGMMEMAFES